MHNGKPTYNEYKEIKTFLTISMLYDSKAVINDKNSQIGWLGYTSRWPSNSIKQKTYSYRSWC